MKKTLLLLLSIIIVSCKGNGKNGIILPTSTGNTNKILVVTKGEYWEGKLGDGIRVVFGEHQVGLPQPETLLSVSQIDPSGFKSFMRNNKAVLILRKGKEEAVKVMKNKYAKPQVVIYVTAKDEDRLASIVYSKGKEIVQVFKDEDIKFIQNIFKKEKLDDTKFKTLQNLGVSLIIPKRFKLVDDTGSFLWLRQHLSSGIARGDGTNNILVYSVPLNKDTKVVDNIVAVRDTIGKKYIPGSKKEMYMITEQAYTPHVFEVKIDDKKAYETRGKWEVKDDFMAGPFLNYTVVDKKNNRLVIVEGFTYAPSVNKRNFVFELEAIAKSLRIKD